MALTAAQRQAVLEALEVPDATGYYVLQGLGTLAGAVSESTSSAGAVALIDATLAAIALNAGKEALLVALCTEWIACSSSTMVIDGGIGNLSGAKLDPEKKRARIASRIKLMVPYFRYHEVLAKQAETDSRNQISIVR